MKALAKVSVLAVGAVALVLSGVGIAGAASGSGGSSPTKALASPDTATAVPMPSRNLYTPIANCRIANTAVAGGMIPNGATRNFQVTGKTGFTTQGGGVATGCGIPASASAVSASIAALAPKASGAFVAYATGKPTGQGTLYYAKGVNIVTGQILGIGTGGKITIKNVEGPANTAIDVNGYYSTQYDAFVQTGGTLFSATAGVLSSAELNTGEVEVTLDQNVENCAVALTATSDGFYVSGATDNDQVFVSIWTLSSTGMPVPANSQFNLTVTC